MIAKKPILVIYTGGTIGSTPSDPGDPGSPLVAAPWEHIRTFIPDIDGFDHPIEYLPLDPVDSSDMTPAYWVRLAREIAARHDRIAGVVILHGTDTMAWTASALSFLLENLDIPVILTGARHPLSQSAGDGVQHIISALLCAGRRELREVCICFDGRVFRGNRAIKTAGGKTLYESPHCDWLGKVNWQDRTVRLNQRALLPRSAESFRAHDALDPNVMVIHVYPGMPPEHLRAMLGAEGLRGAVLRTFGSGNAPTTPEFLDVIARAVRERGLVIANITQCAQGRVNMGAYGAGAGLARLGVLSGGDMTTEAAATKLMALLGRGLPPEHVSKLFLTPLCGERSVE